MVLGMCMEYTEHTMIGSTLRLTRDITSPALGGANAVPHGKEGDIVVVVKTNGNMDTYGILVENSESLRYRIFKSEYILLDSNTVS